MYFVWFKPFEDPGLNKIEIFNEFIILVCCYHMFVFTGGITYDVYMIYKIGWSMDIMLILQFIINIVILTYGVLVKLKNMINRLR